MNLSWKILCTGGIAMAIAACVHGNYEVAAAEEPTRLEIDAKAGVDVTPDGSGGYKFKYASPFADEDGNFDFSKGDALGKAVVMEFTIADGPAGLRFKDDGRDAIWIVDKKYVGPDGSPEGPYKGDQFTDFVVTDDGKRLTVMNKNNDSVLYRYALRFELDGKTIAHDPDSQNGGGGHG